MSLGIKGVMKGYWTYGDLVDLEYLLGSDRESLQADLHRRDRQIYLNLAEEDQQAARGPLLQHWLRQRRSQVFPEGKSPGQAIAEAFRTFCFILMVCGVVLGLTSGLTFFTYSGSTPVNVINFLFLFVFSQLLMLFFLVIGAGLRLAGVNLLPAPVTRIYGAAAAWSLSRSKKLHRYLPEGSSAGITQLEGLLKKQRETYGAVFYWPLFGLSQRAMVCFNLGLLAATCFRILTSDIAFGWQSTIQFSTEFIARSVKILALPWSWFIPGHQGYPSAAQIEGSRIILKDGIYHLQTQDLVSWWPFLVLCVLFYGVLVRLLLVVVGKVGQGLALQNLKTDRPVIIQLVNRLKTPRMKSQAVTSENNSAVNVRPEHGSQGIAPELNISTSAVTLLLSTDISENYDPAVLEQHLRASGFSISGRQIYHQDPAANRALFEGLLTDSSNDKVGIMLVMESWMPPINETLQLIKDIRLSGGRQVPIFVGLVGQGSDRHSIFQPAPVERKIWRQKLDGLADPYLSLHDIGVENRDAS